MSACPVCNEGVSQPFRVVDGYQYFSCDACDSIHVDHDVLADLDAGIALVGEYGDEYWEKERISALKRASGMSLCRLGEAILYCRRPVERFLDIGSGPGFLLQEVQRLIDPDGEIFHAVEKYPPTYAVDCPNFHRGGVDSLEGSFDAGVCIEVVEHLTPRMLDQILFDLAPVCAPGSLWLFNTGMPDYVRNEDPGYLDPVRRGHIVSYSLAGLRPHFERHGFRIGALPGRSFGFFAEFQPSEDPEFESRFCAPLPANLALLQRHGLLYHAAYETARSYFYYAGYLERTLWALSLNEEIERRAQSAFSP